MSVITGLKNIDIQKFVVVEILDALGIDIDTEDGHLYYSDDPTISIDIGGKILRVDVGKARKNLDYAIFNPLYREDHAQFLMTLAIYSQVMEDLLDPEEAGADSFNVNTEVVFPVENGETIMIPHTIAKVTKGDGSEAFGEAMHKEEAFAIVLAILEYAYKTNLISAEQGSKLKKEIEDAYQDYLVTSEMKASQRRKSIKEKEALLEPEVEYDDQMFYDDDIITEEEVNRRNQANEVFFDNDYEEYNMPPMVDADFVDTQPIDKESDEIESDFSDEELIELFGIFGAPESHETPVRNLDDIQFSEPTETTMDAPIYPMGATSGENFYDPMAGYGCAEEEAPCPAEVLFEYAADKFARRKRKLLQKVGDEPAREALVVLMPCAADHDGRPVAVRGIELGDHAPARRGIGQPFALGLGGAFLGPVGQHDIQVCSCRAIRIAIAAEQKAGIDRTLHLVQHRVDLAPVATAARLEVGYLRADTRRAHKVQHFVDRLKDPVAFGPHVGCIQAALCGGDLGELDDLLRRRVLAGLVYEARREPPTALVHALLEERLHLTHLVVGCRTASVAHHRRAQRIVADELHRVHGGPCFGKHIAILGERAPCETRTEYRSPVGRKPRLAVSRRHRATALSVYLGRNALRDLRGRIGLYDEICV